MKIRVVETAPSFENEVVESVRALSIDAQQQAVVAYDTLWNGDPPLGCRCGLLDMRYEVFALPIEKNRDVRFVVSIDRNLDERTHVLLHGVLPTQNITDTSGQLVARHRKLINPLWEC